MYDFGGGAVNGLLRGMAGVMWCSCPPPLLFSPHFLQIVVDVKASRRPHLITVVGGRLGHSPCIILYLHELFLCQSNLVEITVYCYKDDEVKSGHPQFFGALPDMK